MSKKQKSGKLRARVSAKKNRIKRQNIKHTNNILKRDILKWDSPILYQVCNPVSKDDDLSFVKTMRRTLEACKDGVGIAAPQVGESKCIVLWKSSLDSVHVNVMINPIIVEASESRMTITEGCLSYPGFAAKVERATNVKVRWMDEKWNEHVRSFEGRSAIVVQHEIDHLSGFCKVGDAWKESLKEDTDKETVADEVVIPG
jgi:peptide deformylase